MGVWGRSPQEFGAHMGPPGDPGCYPLWGAYWYVAEEAVKKKSSPTEGSIGRSDNPWAMYILTVRDSFPGSRIMYFQTLQIKRTHACIKQKH